MENESVQPMDTEQIEKQVKKVERRKKLTAFLLGLAFLLLLLLIILLLFSKSLFGPRVEAPPKPEDDDTTLPVPDERISDRGSLLDNLAASPASILDDPDFQERYGILDENNLDEADYQNIVSFLESQIDSYVDQVNSSQSQINSYHDQIADAENQIRDLQGQIDELTLLGASQEQIDAILAQISEIRAQILDWQIAIVEIQGQIDSVVPQIDAIRLQLRSLLDQIEDTFDQIGELESQVVTTEDQVAYFEQIEALREQIEFGFSQINETYGQISSVDLQVQSLELAISVPLPQFFFVRSQIPGVINTREGEVYDVRNIGVEINVFDSSYEPESGTAEVVGVVDMRNVAFSAKIGLRHGVDPSSATVSPQVVQTGLGGAFIVPQLKADIVALQSDSTLSLQEREDRIRQKQEQIDSFIFPFRFTLNNVSPDEGFVIIERSGLFDPGDLEATFTSYFYDTDPTTPDFERSTAYSSSVDCVFAQESAYAFQYPDYVGNLGCVSEEFDNLVVDTTNQPSLEAQAPELSEPIFFHELREVQVSWYYLQSYDPQVKSPYYGTQERCQQAGIEWFEGAGDPVVYVPCYSELTNLALGDFVNSVSGVLDQFTDLANLFDIRNVIILVDTDHQPTHNSAVISGSIDTRGRTEPVELIVRISENLSDLADKKWDPDSSFYDSATASILYNSTYTLFDGLTAGTPQSFEQSLTGLDPNTTYYYQLFDADTDYAFTGILQFFTLDGAASSGSGFPTGPDVEDIAGIVVPPISGGLVPCGHDIDGDGTLNEDEICGFGHLVSAVANFIKFVLEIAVAPILGVGFLYAGFLLMTSQQNPTKRQTAKTFLMNLILGLVIVLFAWFIVALVLKGLTGSIEGPYSLLIQ